jgi:hypothetical protein
MFLSIELLVITAGGIAEELRQFLCIPPAAKSIMADKRLTNSAVQEEQRKYLPIKLK